MKKKQLLVFIVLFNLESICAVAQDSLITAIAKKNYTLFTVDKNSFKGGAWDTIIHKAQKSDFVLIGEDHFTNEIPFFCNAITDKIKFDNFFCEIDPYSSKIIQSKIETLSDKALRKYELDFGNTFSFYSFAPEFNLIKKMVKSGTSLFGTDQILMVADRLICNDLKMKTKNKKAKKIYERIEEKSKIFFLNFLNDQNNPIYLLTEDFDKDLTELSLLKLSYYETERIEKLKLTVTIYKEQNHHLRIQLMKNQLMKNYTSWVGKKNLFKFGVNHLAKGESLLKIYDIGNLVNSIADSQYKSSLHIMIVGKSGTQASPFKGYPEEKIDASGDNLKALKPFFDIVEQQENWYCIDMLTLRQKLESGKIITKDIELSRIIKGYDYVIIIPKVSAAKFPN